jgi:RND superfamily putative drug exporter
MRKITDFVLTHKLIVLVVWLALAGAGIATISTTTSRLTESFALPGQPGYQTNEKIDALFHGGGAQEVTIATVTVPAGTDVTDPTTAKSVAALFATSVTSRGGPPLRLVDGATTGDGSFVTTDHRTAYAAVFTQSVHSPTQPDPKVTVEQQLKTAAPTGWVTGTTGINELTGNGTATGGNGLLAEVVIGAVGALLVLAFVFASFLAVVPLLMAAAAIPSTFLLVLALTGVTDVSSVVQFLIGLIGLGVAIDYSLLVVTRWRELRDGGDEDGAPVDNDTAVRLAMSTAGRAVVLSGVTVSISLLALALLPVPYLRSIGFAGFFIPLTSIAVAVTLLPVLLATVGPRLDRRRLRRETDASRAWTAWAGLVVRHKVVAAVGGVAVIALLVAPFLNLRIGSPTSDSLAQSGPAHTALTRLTSGGVPVGVTTPIEVLTRSGDAQTLASNLRAVDGVHLVTAPTGPQFTAGGATVVDVFPTAETSTTAGRATIHRIQAAVAGDPAVLGVGGTGAEDIDFSHAVYGNFGYVLAVIGLVTFLLLTRALRSLVLAVKAVLLNLLSVGAAYGVLVFVWQQGHGSNLWGVPATGSITVWVPVAVFAFLFGLSMDYEVFILTRMREAYDQTGSTTQAIITGIGRTGRLVTSAALILFLAFVSLASGPEVNIKILATGLGAGILIDAVVIRSVLVPAFVALLGQWNWYLPTWMARVLRVQAAPIPSAHHEARTPQRAPVLAAATPTGEQ